MKHNHHIVPRHMGGSNDPSNIISLSVLAHAEAHKKLYEQHNFREDYVAWKALSGQIGCEEIFLETSRIGGMNNKGNPKSKEHVANVSKALTGKKYRSPTPEFVWEVETPSNTIEVVYNLTKFCKEHGINSKRVYKGTVGFKVISKNKFASIA